MFKKNSCQLIGFTDLGEVNNQLDKIDQLCQSEGTPHPTIATHVSLFMVRGMFSNLEFPYAHFSVTADPYVTFLTLSKHRATAGQTPLGTSILGLFG